MIIRMASGMNADLVVVGGIIHTGINGLIIDSTAEAVAKNLDCSVLIIKPSAFVTSEAAEDH
jgi:nucleotide-binding universal stress UspA family protein